MRKLNDFLVETSDACNNVGSACMFARGYNFAYARFIDPTNNEVYKMNDNQHDEEPISEIIPEKVFNTYYPVDGEYKN